MPVYKDNKNGTWYVSLWFTAWDGSKKKKLKRGLPQNTKLRSMNASSIIRSRVKWR